MDILTEEDGTQRANRVDLLEGLESKNKIEFLSECYEESMLDMEIVRKWEDWFKLKKIPYAVIRKPYGTVTILKQQYAYLERQWKEANHDI